MDLKNYYRKIREVECQLPDTCVLVSNETPNGGRAGVRTETTKQIAARMIVDGRARPATDEEAREFLEERQETKRIADQLAAAQRMQITVLPANELRSLREAKRLPKE
jgi:hypothetical protein